MAQIGKSTFYSFPISYPIMIASGHDADGNPVTPEEALALHKAYDDPIGMVLGLNAGIKVAGLSKGILSSATGDIKVIGREGVIGDTQVAKKRAGHDV